MLMLILRLDNSLCSPLVQLQYSFRFLVSLCCWGWSSGSKYLGPQAPALHPLFRLRNRLFMGYNVKLQCMDTLPNEQVRFINVPLVLYSFGVRTLHTPPPAASLPIYSRQAFCHISLAISCCVGFLSDVELST